MKRIVAEPGDSFAPRPSAHPRILGTTWADTSATLLNVDNCTVDGKALDAEGWAFVLAAPFERLPSVSGSFAVAWRDEAGTVHLARDPVGHRALYYASAQGRGAVFGAKLRDVLDGLRSATGARPRLNLRAISMYLTYAYVPGRDTLVEGAFEVLPGEVVTLSEPVLRRPFLDLVSESRRPDSNAQDITAHLRRTVEHAVHAAMQCAGPSRITASLSGGVDSSAVVALAAKTGAPLSTYSITFGAAYRDELVWSSLVAEHCGTEHNVVELTPASVVAHLDDTIACMDKPNGDPLTVPNALLFRAIANDSEAKGAITLNGEGGDPCFGGPKNQPMLLCELYGGDSRETQYLRAHLKCFDDLEMVFVKDAHALALQPPLESDLEPYLRTPSEGSDDASLISRLMALNIRFKGGHHILPKVEALASPFGVTARSPLFAKEVVQCALAMRATDKLRGSVEKYLFKECVRDILPTAIIDRPKSGMMVPVEGWFRGPLEQEAKQRVLDGLRRFNLFDESYLERVVSGRLPGLRPRHGVKTWLFITLESHLRALGF